MRLSKSAFITLLVMALGSTASARPADVDNPQDLGTLGGSFSVANGIAPGGANIAGNSTITGDTATHAVLWEIGNVLDLGVFPGGTNSSASAATSKQRAAGTSDYNDPVFGVVPHAFLFVDSMLTDLGTLGGSQSQGNGINRHGAVVGLSVTTGDAATHAFVSDPSNGNALVDLGTLGGANSAAQAINRHGLVAGSSQTTATDQYGNQISDAVIWDTKNGKAYDLGTLGGTYAQANAINGCAVTAGFVTLTSGQTDAFVGGGGSNLTDIGNLGGSYAQANGINDFGVVVGFSNTTGNAGVDAFVWTSSKGIVDLNSLLPASSPWVLNVASAINNRGEIVGYGTFNGENHAFLWKLSEFAGGSGSYCACQEQEKD
ncbi:MAG: hypothetical protein JO145_12375 [Acidobacteriaceae bacterium]|nr:hypothetical protein [Acidobacteriaceae bacterium]